MSLKAFGRSQLFELREDVKKENFDMRCDRVIGDLQRTWMTTTIAKFQLLLQLLLHIRSDNGDRLKNLEEIILLHPPEIILRLSNPPLCVAAGCFGVERC